MPAPSKLTDWLDKIPGWLKAAFGLIGTISAFIIAFRENWRLYTTIAVSLVLVYLFGISLYILLKRRKLRSKKNQWIFLYAKYRPWGLLGLATACLILAGLLAMQPTRQVAIEGIFGTPTPVPPPQLSAPDVLIAQFDTPPSSTHQVEYWLEDDLQTQLRNFGLNNVTVQVSNMPVTSEEEAQKAVNETGSKVVIWGWYDANGIQVKIFLSGGEQSGTVLPGTKVIPLLSGGDTGSEISVIITEVLPQNVSFLSLFVIGHLEYLSNNYQAGHRAFDAAMSQIPPPDKVTIQNQAILHFFIARQMDRNGENLESVICEYAKAIELDPQFDVAYNNLGLVISRLYRERGPRNLSTPIPSGALNCLQQAGLPKEAQNPANLFERALLANPKLTIAAFNEYAFAWVRNPTDPWIESQLEFIQSQDPSLIGTYIILGITKDGKDDPAGAIRMYQSGIAVEPNIALMHYNLGQLYLSQEKDEVRAEHEFLEALRLDPNEPEIHLALGNLYYRHERIAEAVSQLEPLLATPETEFDSPRRMAYVLRSALAFKQDQNEQAIEYINHAIQMDPGDPFLRLLLGLLYQYTGQYEQAALNFDAAIQQDKFYDQGGWTRFKELCFTSETQALAFRNWALDKLPLSNCLPAEPKSRLIAVYDLLNDTLLKRRLLPLFSLIGAQCPYVYTDDPFSGEWEFQTSILYKLVDREAEQLRPLTDFNGKLLIREEELETSYINRLYVLAKLTDGSIRILEPDVHELKLVDGKYIVLNQSDEILVSFDEYPIIGDVSQWWVKAVGYYTPLR